MPQFNDLATALASQPRQPFSNQQIPESVRGRLLAASMLQRAGADASQPIYSKGLGIAKMGAGLAGGLMQGMETAGEEQAQAQSRQLLVQALQQKAAQGGYGLGGPGAPSAPAPSPGQPTGAPGAATSGAAADHAAYIQQKAAALGIDPGVALTVAQKEGLGATHAGDGGSSFGDFQLHYGGMAPGGNAVAGLGDDFVKAGGDPSNWQAADDFALQNAAKNGWGAFHGAANAGIKPMQGIGQAPQANAGSGPAPQVASGVPDAGGAGVPPDAMALAGPGMASDPGQQAITQAMGSGPAPAPAAPPPGAPSPLAGAMMSAGQGGNDPDSAQKFADSGMGNAPGPSPLASALMGGSGSAQMGAGAPPAPPQVTGASQAGGAPSAPQSPIMQALLDQRIPDSMKSALVAPPQMTVLKPDETMVNPYNGSRFQAPHGPMDVGADHTVLGSNGQPIARTAPPPMALNPGQHAITFGQGPQPTDAAAVPPTPNFGKVPDTALTQDATTGNFKGIPGGTNAPVTFGVGNGVSLPGAQHTNPDGTTSATMGQPAGGAPGGNPLAGAQPAIDAAAANAAKAEGLKTGAEEQVKGAQKYVDTAAQAGAAARGHVGELSQLAQLAQTAPSGLSAAAHQLALSYHLGTSATGDQTQEFTSLRDYLGTQLRQVGSGALKNQEMDKLANSLGSLDMTPAGRAASIQRMSDTMQRAATLGDVASDPSYPDPMAKQQRIQHIAATWDNADAAVAKRPDLKPAIVNMMQQNGVPPVGF